MKIITTHPRDQIRHQMMPDIAMEATIITLGWSAAATPILQIMDNVVMSRSTSTLSLSGALRLLAFLPTQSECQSPEGRWWTENDKCRRIILLNIVKGVIVTRKAWSFKSPQREAWLCHNVLVKMSAIYLRLDLNRHRAGDRFGWPNRCSPSPTILN